MIPLKVINFNHMKISIVGTGYVGLVSGTCFAETGVDVVCVDVDKRKIEMLNSGQIPIYEPGLEDIYKRNMEKGRLSFTSDLPKSLENADAVFIAVGTPPGEDGSADLTYVLNVAGEIGKYMDHYLVVVTKSTVPVGTSVLVKEAIEQSLKKRGADIPFDVASNPEFLKEGSAVQDFLKPDRIVIGTESEKADKVMKRLYKPFLLNGHPILFMDITSSEMTKYAANSMLATRISFINDIANLCEILGADIDAVRKGIGSDPRIGNKFIYPGAGYGGSCFPKDVQALIRTADENGYSLDILKAVETVNNRQKSILSQKISLHFNGNLQGKRFAMWGLAFKPKTDDMREAPALVMIDILLQAGAQIIAYDPVAMKEAHRILGEKIEYAKDEYEACIDADAIVLMTEWSEFRLPNFKVMARLMKHRIIFDGRNIYDPAELADLNFTYYSIGRKSVKS
jgi:UDPglucose 6-dehydrogenase